MSLDASQPAPPISLKRRMLGGGAWVLFGKAITVLCALANEALLTRMLGQEGYGVYVIAFSLVSVAAVTAQLGLHHTAIRFVAESLGLSRPGRARETLRLVYRWAVVGAVAVFILMIAGPGGLLVRRVWDAPELAASIGSLAVWSVLISFQVISSESFRGFKDLRFAALFGGAVTGVLNVSLLTLIYLGWGNTNIGVVIRVIVLAMALSLGTGLLVLYRLHASKLPVERGSLSNAELFDMAAPLWAIVMVNNMLAHADRWILGAFLTKSEVGIYGAAARLVMLVSQPLILINLLVPPYIAELYAKGETRRLERILRQTAALAGIPAILVLFAFIFFGAPILGTFYPDAYRAGATILAILSISKVVNVLTGSSGITMAMTGHQHVLMRIAIVGSGLSIVGCYFVVQRWGSLGVAIVVTAGSSVVFLLQWLATRKYTGMWTHPSIPSIEQIRKLFR
jgi:O-antigen/teichoic acid export membrane protein